MNLNRIEENKPRIQSEVCLKPRCARSTPFLFTCLFLLKLLKTEHKGEAHDVQRRRDKERGAIVPGIGLFRRGGEDGTDDRGDAHGGKHVAVIAAVKGSAPVFHGNPRENAEETAVAQGDEHDAQHGDHRRNV